MVRLRPWSKYTTSLKDEYAERRNAAALPQEISADKTWLLGYIAKSDADKDFATYAAMAALAGVESEEILLRDFSDEQKKLWELANRAYRNAVRQTRNGLATRRGILCFSPDWRDPVIWAHYSDKHEGICLGFEIPDDVCKKVTYVPRRLPFPTKPVLDDAQTMLFTKFDHWK